jgi:type IV pilus assembly protein PilY1
VKTKNLQSKIKFLILTIVLFSSAKTATLSAYNAKDFNWRPPFTITGSATPSVTLLLDSSESMHRMAYAWQSEKTSWKDAYEKYGKEYNSAEEYYGYFDIHSKYSYNNAADAQYFYVDNSFGQWNGNFMNWATMHRLDIIRKLMTGGRYVNGFLEVTKTNELLRPIYYQGNENTTGYGTDIILRQIPETIDLIIEKQGMQIAGPFKLRIKADLNPKGILDEYKDKARFSLFRFYYKEDGLSHKGGQLLVPMGAGDSHIEIIKDHINNIILDSKAAPLEEALFTIGGYLMQANIYDLNYSPKYERDAFEPTPNATGDPYYFSETNKAEHCAPQNIIVLSPGESAFGESVPIGSLIPDLIYPNDHIDPITGKPFKSNGKYYLFDTAQWLRTEDLRQAKFDTSNGKSILQGTQNAMIYIVSAFGKGSSILKDAAMYGGFNDKDGNGSPVRAVKKGNTITYLRDPNEYDSDGDGLPDNYFEGATGEELRVAITSAFDLATRNLMSGTAAAVASETRSGIGSAYQAIFYPPTATTDTNRVAPDWTGQIHAYFVDSYGNLREDTNNNKRLDVKEDKIIKFIDVGNTVIIKKYLDINGDSVLSESELLSGEESAFSNINFLWSSTNWLNSDNIDNTSVKSNRLYNASSNKRFIFTFADINGNMIPDSGEIQNFELLTAPVNVTDPSKFYTYLTLYESTSGKIGPPTNSNLIPSVLPKLAKRQVDYIRGYNSSQTIEETTILDPIRTRAHNGVTWRLGDIVTSSPLVVGAPSANYHIIHKDRSFFDYYQKYKNRRQVIYVGANDGMLHAFNGGFFNKANYSFELKRDDETQFELGSELWAYVPFNLLPHLRWLMNPEYGPGLHVPYMDLTPRAFDVRIFFENDGITPSNNSTHPNGWGTILVAGMRLGGGMIQSDIDKNYSLNSGDRTMSSAYVIMDITNPETEPVLLAEVNMPKQGFTTCVPAIMPMSTANNYTNATANQWYLVFGSGPADATGKAHHTKMEHVTSDQEGHLYILDLKSLTTQKLVKTLDNTGAFTTSLSSFATTEEGSFIGDPATVDFDLLSGEESKSFKTDVVYYGTVSGDHKFPSGKMYRLITDNNMPTPTVNWEGNTTLIDIGKPVTSAPSVVPDNTGQRWVFFGTGRFFDTNDIPEDGDTEQYMTFFGIKDPISKVSSPFLATSVNTIDLFNSTRVSLQDDGTCYNTYNQDCVDVITTNPDGTNSTSSWESLIADIDESSGWRYDFFNPWERVLGRPSVLGGTVFFTSYLPNIDICEIEGTGRLYGLYYKSGTPYYKPIFRDSIDPFSIFIGLGQGVPAAPAIHIGENGPTIFAPSSSGVFGGKPADIDMDAKTLFWRKNIR